jgi:tRNA (guanine37-N1)-methyltransferase
MFTSPFAESIVARAIDNHIVTLAYHDLRNYGIGNHRQVDDRPYGGGAGMVLRPEPLFFAVRDVKEQQTSSQKPLIVLLTPQGEALKQQRLCGLSRQDWLILICGHYEGVDERVREKLIDLEISIGDYILTGGELAAMTLIDGIVRLLPGALGDDASTVQESFSDGLLEYPHYTRPEEFEGMQIPEVLRSGNHGLISAWRTRQALKRTHERRPDLLSRD